VIERPLFYRWSSKIVVTLLLFLIAQMPLLFKLLYHVRKSDTVYVNTLLPFGALLAGKLKGAKVILHVHEVSLKAQNTEESSGLVCGILCHIGHIRF
jgi:Na+-transporting NADH:ubiquinone oxidoreductase subunit NqrB